MAQTTKGTQVYLIDPEGSSDGPTILNVACVTSIDGLSAPRDQNDSTCLESEARTYEPGLATPGQATLGLNFDPASDAHKRVYDLWQAGTKFDLAIGFGSDPGAPTLDTSLEFDLPTTRSWIVVHDVYFADVPLSLALNALVTASVTVQLSGFPQLFQKITA